MHLYVQCMYGLSRSTEDELHVYVVIVVCVCCCVYVCACVCVCVRVCVRDALISKLADIVIYWL